MQVCNSESGLNSTACSIESAKCLRLQEGKAFDLGWKKRKRSRAKIKGEGDKE